MDHKKRQVKIILDEIAKTKNVPLNEDGSMDVDAFNKLPEIIKAKQELIELGADKKYLFKYFWVAGMVLNFR